MTTASPCPRRHPALPAVVVAALIALAGCTTQADPDTGAGSDTADDDAATSASSEALLPPAEGTTQYPLPLTTWAGETVLEERPERVAVIGFSPNRDALEAIGATPVYTLGDEAWEWSDQDWVSGIEVVDTVTRRDPLNYEGIAAAEPDLIVAANFIVDTADFDRLSEIAPVLENSEQIPGDQIDWRATQRLVGEALDLSAAAEAAITEAEEAIADTAQAHPEFAGRTITIAYDYAEADMEYYTVSGGTAEEVVGALGFAPNPLAENFVTEPGVSDEQVGLLDADALVVFYNDQAGRDAREDQELFQTLAPVSDGRYVSVLGDDPDSGANATWVLRRGASALSLPWAVEVIAEWLTDVDLS